MADKVRVYIDMDALFERANQSAMLRAKIRDRANRVAARARRLDQQATGGKSSIEVRESVLPNGRFIAQVESDDVDGEFGNGKTARRRTLRQAMGSRR